MKAKYKVYLNNSIYAILTLDLNLSKEQKQKAEILDIDEEAQNNLVNQEFQKLILLLGNSDEA